LFFKLEGEGGLLSWGPSKTPRTKTMKGTLSIRIFREKKLETGIKDTHRKKIKEGKGEKKRPGELRRSERVTRPIEGKGGAIY